MMIKILLTLIAFSLLLVPQLSHAQLGDNCTTETCVRIHLRPEEVDGDYTNDAYTIWAGPRSMENQNLNEVWHSTAFGHSAMKNLVSQQSTGGSGIKNTAFGSRALQGISVGVTGGDYNTAIGSAALMRIDSGYFNTAVGASTMSGNTTGFFNVAVGLETLRGKNAVHTGNYNTALGTYGLWYNTTGSRNTAIGTFSGLAYTNAGTWWGNEPHLTEPKRGADNETGNDNIYIGYRSGPAATNLNGSIAIGTDAIVTADHQLVVGSNYSDSSWGLITDSYWGSGVTSDVPQDFTFNATGGLGDDIAGADLILAGGKSTGLANGGSIKFQTSTSGVTGLNLNALEDRMVIDSTGNVNISNTLTLDAGSSLYDISPAIIIGDNSTDFTRSIKFVGNGGASTETDCTLHYESSNEWIELGCGLNMDTGNILRFGSRQSWISAPTAGTLLNVATSQLNMQSPTIYFTGTDQQGNPDDNSVKVGIGTSTPTEKLTVAGTIESTSGGFKFPDASTLTSADNIDAETLDGLHSSAFALSVHEHSGGNITSGSVSEAWIDPLIARDTEVTSAVDAHATRTDNPHSVSAAQVGAADASHNHNTDYVKVSGDTMNGDLLVYGIVDIDQDLYVMGNIYAESDVHSKKDIRPIDSSLEKIKNIQGVSFEWKESQQRKGTRAKGRHYGVIAQDVELVLPEIVKEGQNNKKKVAYMELIPVLIEAVKEQQKSLEEQQKTISALSQKINKLERELKLKGSMAMVGPNPR